MNMQDILDILNILKYLGIGSILVSCLNLILGHFSQRKMLRFERIILEKENRYSLILSYMLVLLDVKNLAHIDYFREEKKKEDTRIEGMREKELKQFFLEKIVAFYEFSAMFASDNVRIAMKEFINEQTEGNFSKAAKAMRKDLWK